MRKIFLASFFVALIFPCYSYSQFFPPVQIEKGFELHEILKIAEYYKNVPNLSFTVDYKYADSAAPLTVLEHLVGASKVSDGRYYTNLDSSTEYIQGYQYNVAVFHNDSAIVVNDRQEYADLMKLPVLDSVFNAAYVDSMKIMKTPDVPINTLYLYLGPNSPYSNYVLVYDRNNYQLQNIQFYIRNVPTDEGVTSGTAVVTISFSGYSTTAVSQDLFWEDKYIYKQGGEIKLKPAYIGFQLLDNTSVKPAPLPQ